MDRAAGRPVGPGQGVDPPLPRLPLDEDAVSGRADGAAQVEDVVEDQGLGHGSHQGLVVGELLLAGQPQAQELGGAAQLEDEFVVVAGQPQIRQRGADVGVLELAQVGAAGQLPQAVEVLRQRLVVEEGTHGEAAGRLLPEHPGQPRGVPGGELGRDLVPAGEVEGLGALRELVEEAGGAQDRPDGALDVVVVDDDAPVVVHLAGQAERLRAGPAPPGPVPLGLVLLGLLPRPFLPGLGPHHGPERGPGGRGLPAEGVPDAVLLVRAHPAAPRLVVAPGLRRHPGALGHLRHGQPQLLAPGAHRLGDVRVIGLVVVCVARAQGGTPWETRRTAP